MYHYGQITGRRREDGDSSGFGRNVLATDPRTNAQCRADERRITRIIEPIASDRVIIPPRYLADPGRPKLLQRTAYEAYVRMKVAAEADGIPTSLLTITSGYRSVTHQKRLSAAGLKKHGSPEAARKWIAPPGGSPHHTGRAIDLWLGTRNSSTNIPALRATLPYKWLVCNAARFGFFPYANEPWHWEFNPEEFDLPRGQPTPAPPLGPSPRPSPSVSPELQLVQNALRQGIVDANRITSTIFYARHPERRGQPIRPDEPLLAREWNDIRERVVRPVLARATTPWQSIPFSTSGPMLGELQPTPEEVAIREQLERKLRKDDARIQSRRQQLRDLFGALTRSQARVFFERLRVLRRDDAFSVLFHGRLHPATVAEMLDIMRGRISDFVATYWNWTNREARELRLKIEQNNSLPTPSVQSDAFSRQTVTESPASSARRRILTFRFVNGRVTPGRLIRLYVEGRDINLAAGVVATWIDHSGNEIDRTKTDSLMDRTGVTENPPPGANDLHLQFKDPVGGVWVAGGRARARIRRQHDRELPFRVEFTQIRPPFEFEVDFVTPGRGPREGRVCWTKDGVTIACGAKDK